MASNPIDFSSLILGFSSAALSYLGYTDDGQKKVSQASLDIAAQNIEIISLLKEKTLGNLTAEEAKLTNEILTDLRMKFVEVSKAQKG